jgi:hypothetical protein
VKRKDIIEIANEVWEVESFPSPAVLKLIKFANLVAAQNRPWVGLTDEEIKSLPSWWPSYEDAPALIQLVKDVEAKLKEKNT